jgi:hypothetical protein
MSELGRDGGGLDARLALVDGRRTVRLSNGEAELSMETLGCMTPHFGLRRGAASLNAHWLPPFRLSGLGDAAPGLLDHIAGDFLCSPNFGPPCAAGPCELPAHGWTANEEWRLEGLGVDEGAGTAYCELSLESPSSDLPLQWRRREMLVEGQSAYYSLVEVRNRGALPASINIAHHNTVGPDFLEKGCRIALSAERFMTAPAGTEFDDTGRLAPGAQFDSLGSGPLRAGGVADLGLVPGFIGSTDFLTGAIPRKLALGWSCVWNPRLGLAYLCFFPGEAALPRGEIALSFNDLWMQYGGRRFRPWAETDGGQDRTFCLGTENATGGFANGLEYSLGNPSVLGLPTTVEIPAGGSRKLCYGTALVRLEPDLVREAVVAVEADRGAIVLKGAHSFQRLGLEGDFSHLRTALS